MVVIAEFVFLKMANFCYLVMLHLLSGPMFLKKITCFSIRMKPLYFNCMGVTMLTSKTVLVSIWQVLKAGKPMYNLIMTVHIGFSMTRQTVSVLLLFIRNPNRFNRLSLLYKISIWKMTALIKSFSIPMKENSMIL
ncbi:hypothetical protein D3C71_1257120 [compost metagenome]